MLSGAYGRLGGILWREDEAMKIAPTIALTDEERVLTDEERATLLR